MPQISFSELNDLVGSVGIGSIAMLAMFLILDSVTPVFQLVETNTQSQSWTAFVIVPMIVFSYVAGVICVAIGNLFRTAVLYTQRVELDWKKVDEKLLNLVTIEYRNYSRKIDILDGSVAAFLFLAVGVIAESFAFSFFVLGVIICAACLFVSVSCALIGDRTEREFSRFLARSIG